MLYFRGDTVGRELSNALGVRFSIIEPILNVLKRNRMLEVKSSLGFGETSALFALSEAGRVRARESLENNHYSGRLPVPIAQYTEAVRAQKTEQGWLTKEALIAGYRHMVVSSQVLSQIGPAVNSGKSFLIYGQPGNGKTYLAEALFNIESSNIYVPYAIECQGTITQMFDAVYHQRVEEIEESVTSLSSGRSSKPF